ncbi:MAG: type VII secretion AAA-ATPase EccA, partial [Nocardia sp.]|nr:type VII secretion AAA-ATPase EccA [Nocardia sp.]
SGHERRAIDTAGNGRFIRNVIESAEEEREFRLATDDSIDLHAIDEEVLMRIEAADMEKALEGLLAGMS